MDLKTVLICLVIVNLFMGFFTFIIKRTQPTFPGINFWIYSNLFIAAGYFLMVIRDQISLFMSVLLSHTAFITGGFFRISGMKRFFFIKQSNRFIIIFLFIFLLLLISDIYFTHYQDSILIRTLMLGVVLSGISLYTGILILQNKPSAKNSAYYFAALSYFTFSGIFLFRVAGWFFDSSARGLFNSAFINNLQFVSSLIIDIVWTTMFFVLHNQRINEQLRQSENNLVAINKGKDRFMIILAHDLKNVFNSLQNISELILLKFKSRSKEETENDIKILLESSEKGYILLEDLLFWSASNTGNLQANKQKIDFSMLYHSVEEKTTFSAIQKNVTLIFKAPDDPVIIEADFNMMQSILRNLLGNSIKFSRSGDRIEVSVRKIESMAEISVKDTGIGISISDQDKLWDISHNITHTGTSGETGTGLGLLLCKELVEIHEGRIWVESEPGKGSTFSFTVPLEISKNTDFTVQRQVPGKVYDE